MLALLVILVVIQFFRPTKNSSSQISKNDIASIYHVPPAIDSILKKACNDCHSNNTNYPWYNNIQPIGWWLEGHINDGKDELNFSEFGTNSPKSQYRHLNAVIFTVKKGTMPLNSYTWTHREAKLSDSEKLALIEWAEKLRHSIEEQHDVNGER